MSKYLAVAFACFAITAVSADTFQAGCSFCDRYAGGSTSTSTQQVDLITKVVSRALNGGMGTSATGANVTVSGILASKTQMLYFNGTRPAGSINYYTNTDARNGLVNKLIGFFTVAFNCRAVTTPNSFNGNMASVHANMAIYQALYTEFVTQLAETLKSYAVLDDDIGYAGALLGSFGLGATNNKQICSAADCTAAVPIAEVFAATNTAGQFTWTDAAGTSSTITITPGTKVHFNYNTFHNVEQTQSDHSTVIPAPTGFYSGIVNAAGAAGYSFTHLFATEGTYYYKCGNPNHTVMVGTIVVTTGGGAGATVASSLSMVVAAAFAAFALAKRV